MYELFEASMFGYISGGLLLCVAGFYAIVVGVLICNFVLGAIWKWLQDGDEELDNWLKKVIPFVWDKSGVVKYKGKYVVRYTKKERRGFYYGCGSISLDQAYRYEEYHETKEAAQERYDLLEKHDEFRDNREVLNGAKLAKPLLLSIPALGFLTIPTTTLFIVGATLTAYVARSAIRLKKRFDKHIADKEAHK